MYWIVKGADGFQGLKATTVLLFDKAKFSFGKFSHLFVEGNYKLVIWFAFYEVFQVQNGCYLAWHLELENKIKIDWHQGQHMLLFGAIFLKVCKTYHIQLSWWKHANRIWFLMNMTSTDVKYGLLLVSLDIHIGLIYIHFKYNNLHVSLLPRLNFFKSFSIYNFGFLFNRMIDKHAHFLLVLWKCIWLYVPRSFINWLIMWDLDGFPLGILCHFVELGLFLVWRRIFVESIEGWYMCVLLGKIK